MSKEKFKEYYQKENVTSSYDVQREGTPYRLEKRKRELKIFLELLDKKENENVLELGCSSGFLTEHLGKVTAIDTSKNMLEIAQQKNPQAITLEADMFNLPFRNNRFNKVVTMRVWNHLNEEDLRKALKEVKRVLKEDGTLVFDGEEFNILRAIVNFFYKRIFRIKGFKIYRYSIVRIEKILSEEGFTIDKIEFLKHKIGRQMIIKCKKISI